MKISKLKKKWMEIGIVTVLCLCVLAGCGSNAKNKEEESGKLKVVTTIFPAYDFARAVGGDAADVTMLLQPGTEAHTYEPTPKDIQAIQSCDVFIYTGGENDVWVEDILNTMKNEKQKQIRMVDCVDVLEEQELEGIETHEEHEEEHEMDEHVWTSPINAEKIVEQIEQAMVEKDTEHEEQYRQNASVYKKELETLDAQFREVVQNAKRKTVVFGDRFPILYFAEEYGLDYYAAFPGCASDTEPNAATIAYLSDKVETQGIPVVFKIELSNGKVAEAISESTKAKIATFESCHNVTSEDFKNGETYVSLMKKNVEALREALN